MQSGLYVHVPFCRSKCPYCGFYSIASKAPIERWLAGLEKEIVLTQKHPFAPFDSLYLGGGTPSFLSHTVLERVMALIFSHYPLTPHAEITLEANPCDISSEKADLFKSLGFNRINLGVQSFNDRVLTFLGRRHSSKTAENALKHLRTAGFQNVGVDLIYGFKAQSMNEWIATLQKTLAFQPEHLSCYQLTLEKGTAFERRTHQKSGITLPEKVAAAHFLATCSFLESKGYNQYEVSNFARNESLEARHNRKYWQHIPYLGLGPSAHSFDGKKRWWNVRSVKRYCEALEKDFLPIEGTETLTKEQIHLESLALGFRTRRGVDVELLSPKFEKTLLMFQKRRLLKVVNGRVFPTRRGYLLADHLPLHFFS